MKFVIICFIFSTFASEINGNYYRKLFEHWKKTYEKTYNHLGEEEHRYKTWRDNLNYVTRHNFEYALKKHSYRLEMNHFADMNGTEANLMLSGYVNEEQVQDEPRGALYLGLLNIPEHYLPKYVNWKERGYVTRVRYQGKCGGCYAFSATGALEAQHKKKTGNLIELSQQNLIDCSADEGDRGCRGGLMDKAFRYIIKNGGVDTYDSYPYEAHAGSCRFKKENVGAKQVGYMDIPKGNEKLLKEAVATVGPVSVAIDSKNPHFHLYGYGIFIDMGCSKKKMSHGLLVVGYGTTKSGIDYWLVKNSWGVYWGEDGYFRLARNMDNMCGIATRASFPLV